MPSTGPDGIPCSKLLGNPLLQKSSRRTVRGSSGRLQKDRRGCKTARMKALRISLCLALVLGIVFLAGCSSFRAAKLYQSGSAALDRGDVVQSIAELEEASRLAPNASEIQNHLGLAYAEAGEHARAQAAFNRALELDCENSAARQNRVAHRRAVGGALP